MAKSGSRKKPDKVAKRPPGRPSIYTPEVIDALCAQVAARVPLAKVCSQPGMPSVGTVYGWLQDPEKAEFLQKYARAREFRANARSDFIDNIVSELKAGTIDPQVARVIIDAEKWQAGKELPKKYGDRVNVGGTDDPVKVQVETKDVSDLELARWMINVMNDAAKAQETDE